MILSFIFITLKHGIKIDNFKHDNFSIERLYIKLEKKLILNAKNIQIHDPKEKNSPKKRYSTKEIDEIVKNFKYVKMLFEEIYIKELDILNNKISALYKNDMIYIDTPYLTLDTKLDEKENEYIVAINELRFKDFNTVIAGNGKVNLLEDIYFFDGFFVCHEISGKLDFAMKNYLLEYKISNANADSIKDFVDNLSKMIGNFDNSSKWIYGKVIAEEYFLESLEGKFNLKTLDYMPLHIRGKARVKNAYIHFKDTIPAVVADSALIEYKNDNLYFDIKNPTYESKDLNGSKVWLENLAVGNTEVYIDIKTDSMLDKTVLDMLKALKLNVPLEQKSGELLSEILIKYTIYNENIEALGNFMLKDANIEISGAPFYSKSASIVLDNSLVMINNASLTMSDIFSAKEINGPINLDENEAKFQAKFEYVDLDEIFLRKEFNSDVSINFKDEKSTFIDVDTLKLHINLSKNGGLFTLPNINTFLDYSPILSKLGVKSGDVSVESENFKTFHVNASNVNFNVPFVINGATPYSNDSFSITINSNYISGKSLSQKLNFSVKGDDIDVDLKGLDLVLLLKDSTQGEGFPNVNFSATNSNIIFKDINKTLNLNSYSGNLYKKRVKFSGKVIPQGDIFFETNPDIIVLNATNLTGLSINKFLGSQSFSGGSFVIKAVGNDLNDFRVEISMKDTHLTDFIIYQKLLSFLDTIPSLLKLKTPDFNDEGFTVKDGTLYFSKKGDILQVQGMNFMGSSADIAGVGDVNLKTGKINIDLEIIYLKAASGIIDYIPILNQILLGKDRTISTVVKVRGTIQNPTYETAIISDVLMTPINIIKNTIQLPISFFD
ncbi:MAG: DUF3971 domain-containing protein [Campylobacter sp.]|nr:DUF3971 domain-containing protein [Campylobacter sp.]